MSTPFPSGPAAPAPPRFAHRSEQQFARFLDFYGVVWEYEPTEFTLEWHSDGRAKSGFRPDFYLPAYDLYIEITTLDQRLVTKKNRKVRRLRELYPDVEVKVLYQRDYFHLLVKFGLEDAATRPASATAQAARELETVAKPTFFPSLHQ